MRRAPHNFPSLRGPQARGNPALAMTRNPGRAYCRGPDAADRDAVWLFSILVLFSRTSNGFSLGRDLSDRVVERPRRLAEPRRPAETGSASCSESGGQDVEIRVVHG